MNTQPTKGFTLLELLIVIGILAILSAVTILVINPAELLRKSRDTQRISDLGAINSALAFYLVNTSTISMGSTANSYSNVTTTCSSRTSAVTTSQSVNSTGWIPVDLATLAVGSPISKYPVDPNPDTTGSLKRYYVYLTDGAGKWELAANLESTYYTQTDNRESKDGGTIEGLYEVGNKLDLIVRTDNCFNEVYVVGATGPAGGKVFYDQGSYINGWRYLEAAPASTEWVGKWWGKEGIAVNGTSLAVGTGKANTVLVVAKLNETPADSDRAAQLCDALIYSGYTDWFLPSQDEVVLMTNFGSVPTPPCHWGSSELSADRASNESYCGGTLKNYSGGSNVRCTRAF
ncbi:MAG: type II secretion system protein [Candidatus Parcubacteria bacterium]|nr:type II secretion system protein [Candidatus Parcubacteria bacterium]